MKLSASCFDRPSLGCLSITLCSRHGMLQRLVLPANQAGLQDMQQRCKDIISILRCSREM